MGFRGTKLEILGWLGWATCIALWVLLAHIRVAGLHAWRRDDQQTPVSPEAARVVAERCADLIMWDQSGAFVEEDRVWGVCEPAWFFRLRLAGLEERSLPGLLKLCESSSFTVTDAAATVVWILEQPYLAWGQVIHGYTFGTSEEDSASERRARRLPWLEPVLVRLSTSYSDWARCVGMEGAIYHVADGLTIVVDAAKDADANVRRTAFTFMAEEGVVRSAAVLEVVAEGVADPEVGPRVGAILAAARLRVKSALPALIGLLGVHAEIADNNVPGEVCRGASDDAPSNYAPHWDGLAAWAIQEITGRDFGFKSCWESRDDMPSIVERIRREMGLDVARQKEKTRAAP